ncbi:MAG: hypothetical protein JKY37_30575 [Nannocystaceae bacterium]|nr:hypothetical protein [Nannocystaceae bacterium]
MDPDEQTSSPPTAPREFVAASGYMHRFRVIEPWDLVELECDAPPLDPDELRPIVEEDDDWDVELVGGVE